MAFLALIKWPWLFKEQISVIHRISRYPADKFYPLASVRLFEGWIALSSHYPADKVIQVKVSIIYIYIKKGKNYNFYPADKNVATKAKINNMAARSISNLNIISLKRGTFFTHISILNNLTTRN